MRGHAIDSDEWHHARDGLGVMDFTRASSRPLVENKPYPHSTFDAAAKSAGFALRQAVKR